MADTINNLKTKTQGCTFVKTYSSKLSKINCTFIFIQFVVKRNTWVKIIICSLNMLKNVLLLISFKQYYIEVILNSN